eukprot:scaffold4.g4693.t1
MAGLLYAGTPGGLFAIRTDGSKALEALRGQVVNHLAVAHPVPGRQPGAAAVLACACPQLQLSGLHRMLGDMPGLQPEQQQPGLHLLEIAGEEDGAPASVVLSRLAWEGDARSCAAAPPPGGSGPPLLAVGSEPADVHVSTDGGACWTGADGFAAMPSRGTWSFPPPPHQPHCLSIELLPAPAPEEDPAGGGGGGGEWELVAGVEVGGVMRSGDGGASYSELNNGLHPDVHSCRVDPHDRSHWLAVTGRGLYATRNAGASWSEHAGVWEGRYTVGLAWNPERRGEVMVTAGDRPPALGVHVYLSQDGGERFEDVTEAAFLTKEAKGSRTPVPFFWRGQALLGADSAAGQSPSSVMH